jgi:uncharacterized membrane protein
MHVFGVVVWLGGLMFQGAVAQPIMQFESVEAQEAMAKVHRRFIDFIWMSVWTVAVTGLLMMLLDPRFVWFRYDDRWSILLGAKQAVFLLMLFYGFGYSRMLRTASTPPSDLERHRIRQYRTFSVALGITGLLLGAAMTLS